MNALDLFAQPAWRHLVFALLHTLWQGAVLALLLVAALRWVSVRHPQARYLLTLAAQFAVLLAGLATWAILEYQPPRPLPVRHAPLTAVGSGAVLPQARPAITGGAPEESCAKALRLGAGGGLGLAGGRGHHAGAHDRLGAGGRPPDARAAGPGSGSPRPGGTPPARDRHPLSCPGGVLRGQPRAVRARPGLADDRAPDRLRDRPAGRRVAGDPRP